MERLKLEKEDYEIISQKIKKIKTEITSSIVASGIGILALFIIPISFLPKSGRLIAVDKSLTLFEYSKILSLSIIVGLILFEFYYIFISLKYSKIQQNTTRFQERKEKYSIGNC